MLLGVLLVILGKLNKVFPKSDFSWPVFIRTNLISVLMNLVAGLLLVINQADLIGILSKVFPDNPFFAGGLFAGICGIAGVTFVQFLVDIGNPNKKTVV
jgi:hypothetical protein